MPTSIRESGDEKVDCPKQVKGKGKETVGWKY